MVYVKIEVRTNYMAFYNVYRDTVHCNIRPLADGDFFVIVVFSYLTKFELPSVYSWTRSLQMGR